MKLSFFYYFFFILLVFIPLSSAVGVSPPSYKVDFEPNLERSFAFEVRNNVGHDIIVTISLSGDLAKFATIDGNDFPLRVDERGDFRVNLALPDYVDTPGRNQLKIYITEKTTTGGISAKTGVVPIIFVQVPYPGQYAIIEKFSVSGGGVNEGEDTPVEFTIWNQGLDELTNTHADLTLSTLHDEVLDKRDFSRITMSPNARYSQNIELSTATLPPSDYTVVLNYYYGDVIRTKESLLRVGNFDVKLINYSSTLVKGGIVPFTLEVENRWKGKVFVTSTLSVAGSRPMETPRKVLDYFQTAELTAFLDTTSLQLGNNTGEVTLYFEKESPLEGDLPQTKIVPVVFELVEPAKAKRERPDFSIATSTILLAIMILLLVVAIALVTLVSRNKKK